VFGAHVTKIGNEHFAFLTEIGTSRGVGFEVELCGWHFPRWLGAAMGDLMVRFAADYET
jgi:hypothetical protein